MTQPTPGTREPFDARRLEAHDALYDKLGKLRTMLSMLHASGFEHFRRMEEHRQADYLGTCMELADEPFSDQNPEHVRIANKIEVRLVDQGLLPRYADL
ncbi:Imm52 family immunity protein [Ralstonia sp. SET104]|uniref:Imm52 family immunity protein n=1 Tax=Ralstonia sp. SET104 TaxID=2448774 RepID=UPI000F57F848|nr:Imm52 family immunity protein [Ralstonia sp. SET104]GCB05046.1 hypothetical protein PSUB009319_26770 [Ralstonia sp. SET104]